MDKIKIVLLSVDRFEKLMADEIRGLRVIEFKKHLLDNGYSLDDKNILVYTLEDFAIACNEQSIDLDSFWLTYVVETD